MSTTLGLALTAVLLAVLTATAPAAGPLTQVRVQTDAPTVKVPEALYGVGYDGWGDITDPEGVGELQAVRVHFCRLDVNLRELCGERLGDFRWEYTTPRDRGMGFLSRVKRIRENGWTPLLALSLPRAMPAWFQGDADDARGKPWYGFNRDGSPAAEGQSDQWAELSRVTRALAAGLAERGLTGLYWETIYEIGHTMPMADLHHYAAQGLAEADPTARLVGPATWPGWTVQERFVKPYLAKYGTANLDLISMHWYADNEHGLWAAPGWKERQRPVTMADGLFLQYLMETAPKYGAWCRSLRQLLDAQTPANGRRVGIAFSEFDCLATSPYQRNPENPDWPGYRADADCYLNTNYFGGVWCAAVLCGLAQSGCLDAALKFTTRDFYGLIENKRDGGYFRQPVWFAWKLLQDRGGLVPGAEVVSTRVDGPRDQAQAHVGGEDSPWVMATTVRAPEGLRHVLINRSSEPQAVELHLPGAGLPERLTRYLYSAERVARFIGRKPGTTVEGAFEGAPDDSLSARCLQPLDVLTPAREGEGALLRLELPAISLTVLTPVEGAG